MLLFSQKHRVNERKQLKLHYEQLLRQKVSAENRIQNLLLSRHIEKEKFERIINSIVTREKSRVFKLNIRFTEDKRERKMKRTQSGRNTSKKSLDSVEVDYQITISSGEQAIQVPVTLKIRGDNGFATIPLRKTASGEQPFQPNASHEFTARTNDVGRIQRITVEHQGTDSELLWHLKAVQIKKGNNTYK